MAGVTKRQLSLLKPYLIGEAPKENFEWDMFCPLHGEEGESEMRRSASLNTLLGDWYCFTCSRGGGVADLIKDKIHWVNPPSPDAVRQNGGGRAHTGGTERVTNAHVDGWHSALMSNDQRLEYLEGRGLKLVTLETYEIGWDSSRHVYTIPVRSEQGELWNVRRYNPSPKPGRPKIMSVRGMGSPRLYPLSILDLVDEEIIICEGEWDCLLTIQMGFPCITRTASADTWRADWSAIFKGLRVYLAHDADDKGTVANRKVNRALNRLSDVRIVTLPYEHQKKHGKDLSDFWSEHTPADFQTLLDAATKGDARTAQTEQDPEHISVIDSFDATRMGVPVRLNVTIKGRREPGYTVPHEINLSCTRDAGTKCNFCPLNPAGGDTTFVIEPHSPRVLSLLDVAHSTVAQQIGHEYGVPGGKCARLTIEVTKHQSVEVLLARPSLDDSDGSMASDYKNIKITSVGRHDTLPNNTVQLLGSLQANPKTQSNEFLAWDMQRTQTSVDHFEITKEAVALMSIFKARGRPLRKLAEIASEVSQHVTHILGRREMHMLMDLTFHSALAFNFAGRFERRGWLDCLIVGDTRTGKSEAAAGLVRHFGVGEIIGGEMSSVAGIIGGAQQINGKEWLITWGALPLNDRRLVVIDETSGLSHEDIAMMSDVRASGLAKITKITAETTHARTRLLWLSNPRNARMSDYTYGVDAIRPLIGNNEDIARFDMAMAVNLGDVEAEVINTPPKRGRLTYTKEACHTLLLWAWTRQPDQIVWAEGAEKSVLAHANDMGRRYVEDPPLVQAANIRLKIARTAVALAARLFSTDKTHEAIVVRPEHVDDAVAFMDRLYSMGTFGYAERSAERIADAAEATKNVGIIRDYIVVRTGLPKFLRNHAKFRRQDLEEMLDITREEANTILNTLWEARMIRKEGADVRIEATLHSLLREL